MYLIWRVLKKNTKTTDKKHTYNDNGQTSKKGKQNAARNRWKSERESNESGFGHWIIISSLGQGLFQHSFTTENAPNAPAVLQQSMCDSFWNVMEKALNWRKGKYERVESMKRKRSWNMSAAAFFFYFFSFHGTFIYRQRLKYIYMKLYR